MLFYAGAYTLRGPGLTPQGLDEATVVKRLLEEYAIETGGARASSKARHGASASWARALPNATRKSCSGR